MFTRTIPIFNPCHKRNQLILFSFRYVTRKIFRVENQLHVHFCRHLFLRKPLIQQILLFFNSARNRPSQNEERNRKPLFPRKAMNCDALILGEKKMAQCDVRLSSTRMEILSMKIRGAICQVRVVNLNSVPLRVTKIGLPVFHKAFRMIFIDGIMR